MTAMRTLTPFNRDQNAIGTVKVYVHGYDGTNSAPYVISQATITPFDGSAPIVRVLQLSLQKNVGTAANGLVALSGLTLSGASFADSFNSNPTNSPIGPWLSYSSAIAKSNTSVVVMAGSISAGSGTIKGDLRLGSGVVAPSSSVYSGTLTTNYTAAFPLPTYPTAASVSQSYSLGSSLPATLPRGGDLPAADGRYYYFCGSATIGAVTISTGKNVTIVGTSTGMSSGLAIQNLATCIIYMDGILTLTKGNDISNVSWAGALQIFTSTSGTCSIGNKSALLGSLYAPKATLNISGGSTSGMLVGYFVAKTISATGSMAFHYDEALGSTSTAVGWDIVGWQEFQSATDRASVGTLTNNFLP